MFSENLASYNFLIQCDISKYNISRVLIRCFLSLNTLYMKWYIIGNNILSKIISFLKDNKTSAFFQNKMQL